jgi:hypothetical protein
VTVASQLLQAKVDAFRTRKEAVKAAEAEAASRTPSPMRARARYERDRGGTG